MTSSQDLLLKLFVERNDVSIIPVTARDLEQYKRTDLSRNSKITAASMYFSGLIMQNEKIDPDWKNFIENSYKNLNIKMEDIFSKVKKELDHDIFKINMLEQYYLVIKNKYRDSKEYIAQNEHLKGLLSSQLTDEYFIHHNDNNISIIPKFLDKKNAVKYFIDKFKPELTIGAGDSITDLGFMSLCDFKLIPGNSQIDKIFLKTDY